MENLSFEERLIREHTPEPLEGHTVVVLERVGEQGERLHSVIPSGGKPPRPGLLAWMLGTKRFFAFAVEASPERHLAFPEHVVMADHVNEFDLLFDLHYHASDPAAVAANRNKDPLGRIRRKAAELVRREVSRLEWEDVWSGFQYHGPQAVSSCISELRAFAAPYGIAINALYLTERMPEEAIEVDLHRRRNRAAAAKAASDAERDIDVRHSVETVEIATDDSRYRVEQNRFANTRNGAAGRLAAGAAEGAASVQEAFLASVVGAMQRVAGQITTPDEFAELERLKGSVIGVLGSGGGNGSGGPAMGVFENGTQPALANGATHAAALPASSQGRLGGLLGEVAAATQKVKNRNQRLALSSAILHLVAEVLVDDVGTGAGRSEHATRAASLLDALEPAPASQDAAALRLLADPEHLHAVLDY